MDCMVTAALGLAEQQDDGARAPGLPRLCGPLTGGGDSSLLLKLPAASLAMQTPLDKAWTPGDYLTHSLSLDSVTYLLLWTLPKQDAGVSFSYVGRFYFFLI